MGLMIPLIKLRGTFFWWIFFQMLKLLFLLFQERSLLKNGSLASSNVIKTQSLAFNNRFNEKRNQNSNQNKGRNQNLVCKNCGIKGHSIEKCYKLTGYPTDFKQVISIIKINPFLCIHHLFLLVFVLALLLSQLGLEMPTTLQVISIISSYN